MERIEKGILGIVISGTIVSVVIAVFISPFASVYPDGLEKVAEVLGFADRSVSKVSESFFLNPDYIFKYAADPVLHRPLAGLLGVIVILVIFSAVFLIYRAVIKKRKNKAGEKFFGFKKY